MDMAESLELELKEQKFSSIKRDTVGEQLSKLSKTRVSLKMMLSSMLDWLEY